MHDVCFGVDLQEAERLILAVLVKWWNAVVMGAVISVLCDDVRVRWERRCLGGLYIAMEDKDIDGIVHITYCILATFLMLVLQ